MKCIGRKITTFIAASVMLVASSIVAKPVRADNNLVWKVHTGTALEKTDNNWKFLMGDYNHDGIPDLYVIKQQGANSTEVHVLDGRNNYQTFLLHTGTALEKTGSNWQFALGDYNHDGTLDLYVIKQQGPTSTEVHVLDGRTNFQTFLLHTTTALEKTDSNWKFALGDYNHDGTLDLYVIKQQGPASTEVHILDGRTNFQTFLLHTATPLEKTDSNWQFLVGDYNNDGSPDLYIIKQQGATSTEVHVLDGKSNFQNFIQHTATPLEKTADYWQFALGKGNMDIYVFKQQGVNSTEVHEFGYADVVNSPLTNFVSIAQSQLGYAETPVNMTKYGQWYGLNGNAWCAMFVSWCANQAGILNTTVPRYAACSAGAQWYMDRGRYRTRDSGYTPKTGDVIFFNVSGGINHTGIVQSYSSGIVTTIEGNCSDAVRQNSYYITNAYINGYGVN